MKVKGLLSDENKWCKGSLAKNSDGSPVAYDSETATSWCLLGAINLCYTQIFERDNKCDILRCHIDKKYTYGIIDFNDSSDTTFDDIKNLLIELDI